MSRKNDTLINLYVNEGWLWHDDAKLESFIGRKFTVDELRIRIKSLLRRGLLDYAEGVAKKIGEELQAADLEIALEVLLKHGNLEVATDLARRIGRELSMEEKAEIKKARADYAVECCGSELNKTEDPESIIRESLESGYITDASRAAEKIGRKLTSDEISLVIQSCINNGLADEFRVIEIQTGAQFSQQNLEDMLSVCVSKKLGYSILLIAEHLKRKLTTIELEVALSSVIRAGEVWHSIELAKCIGRELTSNEMATIEEMCMRNCSEELYLLWEARWIKMEKNTAQ